MILFDYISIISAFFCLIWAAYLFFRKYELKEARYLSLFIFLVGLWILSLGFANLSTTNNQVVFWTRMCYLWSVWALTSFLLFAIVFRRSARNLFKDNLVFIIFSIILTLMNFIISNEQVYTNIKFFPDKPPQGQLGTIYVFFSLFYFILIIKSCYVIVRGFRLLDSQKKAQIKYVLTGTVLFSLFAVIFNVILPLFGNERFYSVAPATFIFFIGFTSYAIIKHQLLDIKVIIQRSIIYSIVLATVVALYLLILFIFQFFWRATAEVSVLSAVITVVVGIYGVPIIEKYFRRKTDKIFFKDKYDYSAAIFELSEILNKNINLEKLLRQVTNKLKEILKTDKVDIILPGQDIIFDGNGALKKLRQKFPSHLVEIIKDVNYQILALSEIPYLLDRADDKKFGLKYKKSLKAAAHYAGKYNFELMVSIMSGDKMIGLMVLDKKLSGEPYTPEDINLLKTISCQAAVALEKAQLYEEVKKHSEQLEIMVKKRTAKLHAVQEEQKQMMLEVAHGLQTPLTIIKGELELIAGQIKEKKEIESLVHTIDRVSRFIYDMLRLANLETGNKNAEQKVFSLSELLEDLIENFKIITQEQNIIITHGISPNINIRGDKGEIEELVMNIVSNSIKYMRADIQGIVNISLSKNKNYIILAINDNGVGIDKKHLPYLFTKFYRIKDAAHEKKKGTGLGLVICKKIIEKHGGRISVASESGKGTKITIKFPYK